MDFYEALMKYEEIFGDILKKNLEKFKNALNEIIIKEFSKNDDNKNNEFGIENNNIKEIIKEIETSNKLKKLIKLNYDKAKRNKCIIFAKDLKKKECRNYNNQKRIINNNNINKNELNDDDEEIKKMIKKIKEKIKNKIKENYLNEVNKNLENKNPNLTQNEFSNDFERKLQYNITEMNLSKSRDSRNFISITQRNNKTKFKSPINIITKIKKSENYLKDIEYIPNNDQDVNIKRNFHFLKNNNQRMLTEENKNDNNIKIHFKNIKINNGIENNEKYIKKIKEDRPISNKKIQISKFKIGNNEYKLKNNNYNNNHKNNKKIKNNPKQMLRIKPKLEINTLNQIDKNKIKIQFNNRRILSSRMVIKEEDNSFTN